MPGLKLEPKLGVSSYPGPKTGNCIWADLALPALRTKHARIVGAATRTTEDFDHIQTVSGLGHLQRSNTPISDRLQQRQGTRALVMVRWLTVPHKQGLGEPDAGSGSRQAAPRWQFQDARPCSHRHLVASSKTDCHGLCLYLCHVTIV